MTTELRKLYNTLLLVETKGESTKIMGQCLQYTEQLIAVSEEKKVVAAPVTTSDAE